MRLYKIGITGHQPQNFKEQDKAKEICQKTIDTIRYQYENDDALLFNLGGCIGADQWIGAECLKKELNYHLYLPFPPDIYGQFWYEEQQEKLNQQINNCSGLTIVSNIYNQDNYNINSKLLVDNSDFLICFWEGRKQGGTYNTIKYAINKNKLVLNAMSGLSLVSRQDIKKKH